MNPIVFSSKTRFARFAAGLTLVAGVGLVHVSTASAQSDAEKCQSTKAASAGKYIACVANNYSKAIKKTEPKSDLKLDKCSSKVGGAFLKAEDKAAKKSATCPSVGDGERQVAILDACIDGVVVDLGGVPGPGGDEAKCQSSKVKEAGKYAGCRFKELSKAIKKGTTPDYTKCEDKLASKFGKLDDKGGCSTTGDLASVQADIDFCFNKVSAGLEPTTRFAEDFEAVDPNSPTALSDAGFSIFASVWLEDPGTPKGAFQYGYGTFPAPNGTGGFSNVDQNQGGFDQGTKQIVVFADYNNGDQGGFGGHPPCTTAGGCAIESNVFHEINPITADYAGKTLQWIGQYRRGNINDPASAGCTDPNDPGYPSDATAQIFIKTLDPGAGFSETNFITKNTTYNCSDQGQPWEDFLLELDIPPATDPNDPTSLVGQILQVGFSNVTTQYQGTGVLYDNLLLQTIDTP